MYRPFLLVIRWLKVCPITFSHCSSYCIDTCLWQCWPYTPGTYLKPLLHQTAMPRRLYSVLKPFIALCGRREIGLKYQICQLKRVHNVLTASLYGPHGVPTAFLQRPWRFYGVKAVAAACSWRTHNVLTARILRYHGDSSVWDFLLIFWYFEQPYCANIVIYFYFSKQFVIRFNSCLKFKIHAGLAT